MGLIRADAPVPGGAAAATVRTLAVLLAAGAAPGAAWRHLADTGDAVAGRIADRVDDGASLPAAIETEGDGWREVAAAWEIGTTVGAPLADVLRTVADALTDADAAADDVRIALAEPAGTARLLLWMPPAGLLLSLALGFDTIGVIVGTPFGAAAVVLGLLLVLVARTWTAKLVRAAAAESGVPGIRAELTAAALSGGVSVDRALALVDACGVTDATGGRTEQVLRLSRAAGVPAGELLRADAARQRHAARVDGRMRAARLASRLLIPLGVCTLPAFLLLGVAPLMLSVLAGTPLPL